MNSKQGAQPRTWGRPSREAFAVMTALASLVAALVVLRTLSLLGLSDKEVIVTCVLLLPLFVYFIVSGKLSEVQAPAGWVAKFERASKESVKLPNLTIPKSIKVQEPRGGQEQRSRPTDEELRQSPNSLEIVMGASPLDYPICDYLQYIRTKLANGIVR